MELRGPFLDLLFGDMYIYTYGWMSVRSDPYIQPFAFCNLVFVDAMIFFVFFANIVLIGQIIDLRGP